MRLVKVLVGGIIGAAIGAALIVGVEGYLLKDAPWLALAVGVLTGLGVRIMGKTDKPGPCYLSGAIAAALTLLAFVGATMATTKILQARVSHPADNSLLTPLEIVEETVETEDAGGEEPAAETPAAEEPAAEETPAETTAEEPAAETETVEEETAVEQEAPPAEKAPTRIVHLGKVPDKTQEFSWLSFVLIGVGALIAYEMGRNCGCGKTA